MSTTYEAVSADVLAWANDVFPEATVDSAIRHLHDKAFEAAIAQDHIVGGHDDSDAIRRKVVSCALILVHLVDLAGIDDLPAAMAAKLDEDKASRFEMDPAVGYARRVKGGAA